MKQDQISRSLTSTPSNSSLKLAGVVGALFLLLKIFIGSNSGDIHFHDTYIVMDPAIKVL